LFLIIISFNAFVSITIQERRNILVKALKSHVTSSLNPPKNMNDVIHSAIPKSTVIFYGFKSKEIKTLQNKFRLSNEVMEEIKVAPLLKDGGAVGLVDSHVEIDFKKDLDGQYNEYSKTIGTAFKDGDYIYLALIDVKVQINLKIKQNRIEYEECHTTFLFFKSCTTHIRFENIAFTTNEINTLKQAEQYYASLEVSKHLKTLEDKDVQIYINQGNIIYSDDGKYGLYVGDFGDCAIGPIDSLESLIPPKEVYYNYKGGTYIKTYGKYISYCLNNKCENYRGMDIYKLNFIFGNIKSTSTMFKHRSQMKSFQAYGPYALIVYTNGEMMYRNMNRAAVFRSQTRGKGEGPYSLTVTNNGELLLKDYKETTIYKSKAWVKIPTIRTSVSYYGEWNHFVNGYGAGSYSMPIKKFRISIDNGRDPPMRVKYEIQMLNFTSHYWIPYYDGSEVNYNFSNIKATLIGYNAEKYKVCYKIYRYYKPQPSLSKGWTKVACDGEITETGLGTISETASSIIFFITDKNDKDVQDFQN